ncbi:MAG: heparinase II/III family protein [Gemmatimonadota bacterium]|nr:heparinase II/III family protein [Gemmatimonadota bacterium]
MTAFRKAKRLLQMGPREVAGRVAELGRTGTDWLATRGASLPPWSPSTAEAVEIVEGLVRREFFGVAGSTRPGPDFAERFPDGAARAVDVAKDVCRGRIRLFGEARSFGPGRPDWHLDWTSGGRFPLAFYRSPAIHDLDGELEGRAVWETNRQQYLITLAQAYSITGEEEFAERAVGDMESWIEENPPFLGINWSEPLECACRIFSWLWTLRLLAGSAALHPEAASKIIASIWLQARHTRRHLSTYRSPNTHVLGEALGLMAAGTLLPEIPHARVHREMGARLFWAQLDHQVSPDGSHREHSTYYHAYAAEMALTAVLLGKASTDRVQRLEQLRRMGTYLRAQLRPDGTLARMGDDDGGRLLRLSDDDYYAPASLVNAIEALAGTPPQEGTCERLEDTFWYLGPHAVARAGTSVPLRGMLGSAEGASLPSAPTAARATPQPSIFPDVGVGVVRTGWRQDQAWASLHGNPMGFLTAGHSHASLMAVELSLGGHPVLLDPGTYRYVADARNEYRDYRRHNVVAIEGVEAPVSAGPFRWSSGPESWTAELESIPQGLRATRTATRGNSSTQVRHERCIRLLSATSAVVEDLVECREPGGLIYRFHLPPGALDDGYEELEMTLVHGESTILRLEFDGFQTETPGGTDTFETEWYWMSRRYGLRERAPCLVIRTAARPRVRTSIRFDLCM